MKGLNESYPGYELKEFIINGKKVDALFPKEVNEKIFTLVRDMLISSYIASIRSIDNQD
jgi:hypothetical protein